MSNIGTFAGRIVLRAVHLAYVLKIVLVAVWRCVFKSLEYYRGVLLREEPKKVKKVPRHLALVLKTNGDSIRSVASDVVSILKLCFFFKVQYCTIIDGNGDDADNFRKRNINTKPLWDKATLLEESGEQVPADRVRFLRSEEAHTDLLRVATKIREDSRGGLVLEENVTEDFIYGQLACGGTWPEVDCVIVLRDMPWRKRFSSLNQRYFYEYCTSTLKDITSCWRVWALWIGTVGCSHNIVNEFGGDVLSPWIITRSEIYEVWGIDQSSVLDCLVRFSATQQRYGR